VAGKYTLHTDTNDNGKMLSELAMANNFIIKRHVLTTREYTKEHGKYLAVNKPTKYTMYWYLEQCFPTARPRSSTGPWHQL
jgi:hypothetical protein